MRKLLIVSVLFALIGGATLAGPRGSRGNDHPQRYLPQALDGPIVQVRNDVDGRSWSAWAYRNGPEYDLALAVSVEPGVWSEPLLIGLGDGLDQTQPALAVDSRGAVYLAYANGDGAVVVRALQPGRNLWSSPVAVADAAAHATAPSLRVVGPTLVIAFREGDGVSITTLPLLPRMINATSSIYDGPDPTTGRSEDDDDDDQTAGANQDHPTNGVELIPIGEGSGRGHREDD